jgi:uncharacterized membrane protein YgcG
MASVSVYCIGRLALARRFGRRCHHDVNVSHVVMGLAMVGMLVPRWNVIPNRVGEVVFGILAVYFLAMSVRLVSRNGFRGADDDHLHGISHNLIHMVMACAMLYMYWLGMPLTASSRAVMSMSGLPTGAGDPGLTLLIIVVLFASAVWQLDSISLFAPSRQLVLSTVGGGSGDGGSGGGSSGGGGAGGVGGRSEWPWLAPRLEVACHVAMCLAMGYTLVLMV